MSGTGRLAYIDWLRGVAVVLMIQTHVYDSWLRPEVRGTPFHRWSQILGGAPAPLFLFLAGLALALLAESRQRTGGPAAAVTEGARRGLEVLGYAVAFRLWMFTTGAFTRPWDLLRVDVLNCIGLSMAAVAMLALRWRDWGARLCWAAALALLLVVTTPLAWAATPPPWIPDWLRAYWSGRAPGSMFPLFPWAGFTAAGAATGLLLDRGRRLGREGGAVATVTGIGALAVPLALFLDRVAPPLHGPGDFWLTSPSFFLARTGILMLLVGAAWLFHRTPWSHGRSALLQLGRTSLLVYWVHIEIVYGFSTRWARRSLDAAGASVGLALVVGAMLLLSRSRTEGSLARLGRRRTAAAPRTAAAQIERAAAE